jgi:hypothetical protein
MRQVAFPPDEAIKIPFKINYFEKEWKKKEFFMRRSW